METTKVADFIIRNKLSKLPVDALIRIMKELTEADLTEFLCILKDIIRNLQEYLVLK